MKTKIFQSLKQTFASKYGVSDEVLQGYADGLAATGLVTDENLATVIQGQESALRAYQASFDKVRGEKTAIQKELDELKAKGDGGEPVKPQPKDGGDDLDAKLESKLAALLEAKVKPLQDKVNSYEAEKAASERQNLIVSKAKELGITERVMKAVMAAIPENNEGVEGWLANLKQATTQLPSGGGFPMSTPEDSAKELAKEWAQGLPDKEN